MCFDTKKKDVNKFAKEIGTLTAAEFLGLARMLKVDLFYKEEKDDNGKPLPRSSESIIEDCLVKFYALNRKDRRALLRLIKHSKGK